MATFFVLLAGLPLLAIVAPNAWTGLVDGFYRAGALVFGGGHVVLPLLEAETVARGWLSGDEFLAGYGAAQALPGPLFTFAAFLGTIVAPAGPGWISGVLCLIAILLPSMLLVIGILPYWECLRGNPTAKAALLGANAAVVGLLIAAFYDPIWRASITSPSALALALVAFCALQFWKVPPWLLVIMCGLLGGVFLA